MQELKVFLLGAMLAVLPGILSGCFQTSAETDKQIKELFRRYEEGERAAANAYREFQGLMESYDSIKGKADAVRRAISEKRVPVEEGLALLAEIDAQKENIRASAEKVKGELDTIQSEGKEILAEVEGLRKRGVPWYVILMRVGAAAFTGGSGLVALYLKKKLGFFGTVIGALSRAGDTVGHKEFGAAMLEEIKASPGLSADAIRPIHHAARDKAL